MTLRFVLIGDGNAVHFIIYTNWHLHNVQLELNQRLCERCDPVAVECHGPMAVDVGYHSPTPRFEGQQIAIEHCDYIDGSCYHDGSGLHAEDLFNIMLEGGGEAMWGHLEEYYMRTFGDGLQT